MEKLEDRIRQRAYRIWQEEGCPEGRADAHWDMASELVAIEDNYASALKPIATEMGPSGEPIEPIVSLENAGEFPTLTDQGESLNPARRSVD
jgi:hypothetical protein